MSYDEQRISDQIDGGLYHKNQQEMTQETTKEQIPKWIEDYYKADYKSSAGKAVKYLYEQLSAEREAHKKEIERILSAVARGENLANSLKFDGKSELDKERERAGKLVEALNDYIVLLGEEIDEIVFYANSHGWKSKRFEKGEELRQNIKQTASAYQENTNPSS